MANPYAAGTEKNKLWAYASLIGNSDDGSTLFAENMAGKGIFDVTGPTAIPGSANGEPHQYAKGNLAKNLNINAGQSLSFDLVTVGYKSLMLLARMTATAAGDLVITVAPYEDDGVTASPRGLSGNVNAPTLTGGSTFGYNAYPDLFGCDKYKVQFTNNNVAAQVLNAPYFLQK